MVTGEATYYAVFKETKNTYTITWNVEGKITTTTVEYGQVPSFDGTPTKESTIDTAYTFKGWSPSLVEVTGEATYTAEFTSAPREYTITWNVNGTKTTTKGTYGQTPVYQGTPTKTDATNNVYTFVGWALTEDGRVLDSVPAIEEDIEYFAIFSAIEVNGVFKDMYGTYTETVTLANNEKYMVSAVKVSGGLYIYTQALFANSNVNSSANWWESTNFEFKLNGGEQSYVNIKNEVNRVTKFFTKVEDVEGKKLHTIEFYVEKSLIANWSDTADVYLNYAWKNPGFNNHLISEVTNKANVGWSTDWFAHHRYGGLWTDGALNPTLLPNLIITSTGIDRVDNDIPTQDGIVLDGELTEYAQPLAVVGDSAKATIQVTGKVVNGNLYMGIIVTHGAWSGYDGVWANNDNIEFKINNVSTAVVFMQGNLIIPQGIDKAVAVTKEVDGKQVTTIELFVAGNEQAYKVGVGMAGTGFGGWQAIYWDANHITIDSVGAVIDQAVTLENGVVLDGNFTDSIWTDTVKGNAVTAEANGAEITLIGTKTEDGIYLGFTIKHFVAPENSIAGGTDFWCYLNVEFRFNGVKTQYLFNYKEQRGPDGTVFGHCKTEKVDDGEGNVYYISTFEVFVANSALLVDGVSAEQPDVNFNYGGWFETSFVYPHGGDFGVPALNVSKDGIIKIA